jgi:hypothetical protein
MIQLPGFNISVIYAGGCHYFIDKLLRYIILYIIIE